MSAGDSSRVSQETAAQEPGSDTCQGSGDTNLQAQLVVILLSRGLAFILSLLELFVGSYLLMAE